MLLTCPSCSMRYLVADGSIGEEGRKVKCASCGHQWFQEPATPEPEIMPDIVLEDALRRKDETVADIPDSVKPRAEDATPPVLADAAKQMRDQDMIARVCGFFGAFLVFLFLFLMMVVFKGPITSTFPASVMFYELIRLEPTVPGSGLVIDQMQAKVDGKEMVVSGRIINLTTKETHIPPMKITLQDKEGASLGELPVTLGDASVAGENDIDWQVKLPIPGAEAVSVKAGFTLP